MTCIPLRRRKNDKATGFICVSPVYRLKVCGKYIWMEWHSYLGPSFYTDRKCEKQYWPDDEDDVIWVVFKRWQENHKEVT